LTTGTGVNHTGIKKLNRYAWTMAMGIRRGDYDHDQKADLIDQITDHRVAVGTILVGRKTFLFLALIIKQYLVFSS
jgi:hypothetical protein